MLQLVDIKKDYKVADTVVHAVRGISIRFRSNEFVSILGASGCGKTTLLNIIGGLDHYTSGDLIVRGKSTKDFKDADWDVYRNHRIGFIFQSYNLIPHQTVLSNVEMALTIAGVSAEERKQRATEALKRVGLEDHLLKRPNQLSGGQMQRVAIARALVNNPEILLADEPTGALDSETSVQIMELIKEISGERLVIMVTHNPELAEQYSSRIVRLQDGKVVSDSDPYEEAPKYVEEKGGKEKASMSLLTAMKLSFKNLMSKGGRTTLTSIAGSIGIVGVSLVLALSAGIRNYIVNMQDDMLSGNPITITQTGYNMNALTDAMSRTEKEELIKENGRVYIDSYIESLAKLGSTTANMLVTNNITEAYMDYVTSMPKDYYSAITVNYGIDVLHSIYTDVEVDALDGKTETKNMSVAAIQSMYTDVLKNTDFKDFTSYLSMFTNVFSMAPESADKSTAYIESQYDILSGRVATEKDEIMLVLNRKGEATDILLAQLGFISQEQFLARAYEATDPDYDGVDIENSVTFEDILGKSFTWHPNTEIYEQKQYGPELAMLNLKGNYYEYHPYGSDMQEGLSLKVVGILEPKETISYGCLSSGVYYTRDFAKYVISQNKDSEIVKEAKEKNGFASGYLSLGTADSPFDIPMGIRYEYSYVFEGEEKQTMDFVGASSEYSSMMGFFAGMMGGGSNVSNYKMFTARNLGGEPVASSFAIYPVDFDSKNLTTDYLDLWNDDKADVTFTSVNSGKTLTYTAEERDKITYTDSLELVINMINTMVDIVTYALVAFSSISLVVSSVMIGIITYVSVVERTKEIGVLRALGARKKDIKHLFNAETFIIGLFSGLIGIGATYLLSIPVNILLKSLTGIGYLMALPITEAAAMVVISIILTLISGLIPASAAAKKDPVIALRTE